MKKEDEEELSTLEVSCPYDKTDACDHCDITPCINDSPAIN